MSTIISTDLRIGNIVHFFKDYMVVTSVFEKGINITVDPETNEIIRFVPFLFLAPVPITPEMLAALGFVRRKNTFVLNSLAAGELVVDYSFERYWLRLGPHREVAQVVYIHQLQNLIYSLLRVNVGFQRRIG